MPNALQFQETNQKRFGGHKEVLSALHRHETMKAESPTVRLVVDFGKFQIRKRVARGLSDDRVCGVVGTPLEVLELISEVCLATLKQ